MDDKSGNDDRDGLRSKRDKLRQDWLGWWNESGSWFQRRGDAYLNEETVGGRETVTTDEEWVLRGSWREKSVEIARLTGCKNFVGKTREVNIQCVHHLKPMQRSENGIDMWGFRSLNNSTSKRVLDLLEPVTLTVWKVVIHRVTVVKFRMDNGVNMWIWWCRNLWST